MAMQKIGTLIILILFTCSIQAQCVKDEPQAFAIKNKLHAIACKIWVNGCKGTMPVFENDSLTTAMNLESANRVGSVLVIEQAFRNGDPDVLIDTMHLDLLNVDSILSDFIIQYSVKTDSVLNMSYQLQALAPLYKGYNRNGILPIFWIKMNDLEKVLDKKELEILRSFAWMKMQATNGIQPKDNAYQGWQQAMQRGIKNVGGNATDVSLDAFVLSELSGILFNQFRNGTLQLMEGVNKVNWNTFSLKHLIRIDTFIFSWQNPDDPADLIDTSYWEPPVHFDLLKFICGTQPIFQIKQGRGQQQKTYWIEYRTLKKYLHPCLRTLVEEVWND